MSAKLGLKRGAVRLVDPAAEWTHLFLRERDRLAAALAGLPIVIEHVGSTSIPDLPAKPIIDIALGIPSLAEIKTYAHLLEGIGYTDRDDRHIEGDRMLARGPEANRTHYVHIVEHGGKKWQEYILFRDYLRDHPSAREEYVRIKTALAERFAGEREKYTAGKHDFIQHILEKARKAG
ncbi:MAG: GrpB family protein [Anaerolineales bacterium]|nr:GrpB family protein [Anaerolineales bacterium]